MKLERLLADLGREDHASLARTAHEALPASAPADWRSLAALLAARLAAGPASAEPHFARVLGIGGGQGAGKSTLAALLERALAALGQRATVLSLDDFYLTRAARQQLAVRVHPLLETRGVPGTHEVALACEVIDGLRRGVSRRSPEFDKGLDDRLERWREIAAPVDLVIFEGWCLNVAAAPGAELEAPINALEREEDADGRWRTYVNDQLITTYPALWQLIDEFLYLEVPDIEAVLRWRGEQELARPEALRMSPEALRRFVMHYERLTLRMNRDLPGKADLTGVLGEHHELLEVREGPGHGASDSA